MTIDSIWAPVLAGLGALLLAIAGPLVTAELDRRGRKAERIGIEQGEVIRTIQTDMSEYMGAAVFAAGGSTDRPSSDFLPPDLNGRVRELSLSLVTHLNRIRNDRAREAVERYHGVVGDLLDAPDQEARAKQLAAARDVYGETQDIVGKVYRDL